MKRYQNNSKNDYDRNKSSATNTTNTAVASSSSSNNNNNNNGYNSGIFGTPIEKRDEKNSSTTNTTSKSNKYLPIYKQEVRDEKGLKRFHGAFTGGFSAGYFNTVGSKEGFTPSTFKSSRNDKASVKQYTAQDFMDDEDISNMAKELTTKPEFDIFEGTSAFFKDKNNESTTNNNISQSLFDGVFKDIVEPNKDPIGLRLLKKMGWKDGQTRVIKKIYKKKQPQQQQKKKKVQTRIIDNDNDFGGFSSHDDLEEEEEEENQEELVHVEYGKEYPQILEYSAKNDLYGVGFEITDEMRQMRETDDGRQSGTSTEGGNRVSFGGSRSDNIDSNVYDIESKDQYDNYLGGRRRQPTTTSSSQIIDFLKPEDTSAHLRRCTDGSIPLRNFVVASHTSLEIKWFAPPKVPANFNTKHKYDKPLDRSIIERPFHVVNITPDKRSQILQEKQLPAASAPRSKPNLNNYLTPTTTTTTPSPSPISGISNDALKSLQQSFASRFESADDFKARPKQDDQLKQQEVKKLKKKRVIIDWSPAILLCRRFNIENPHKDKDVNTLQQKKEGVDWITKLNLLPDFSDPTSATNPVEYDSSAPYEPENPSSLTFAQPFIDTSDPVSELKFTEEKRPPLDLFKAIFEDSQVDSLETDNQDEFDPFASLLSNTDDQQQTREYTSPVSSSISDNVLQPINQTTSSPIIQTVQNNNNNNNNNINNNIEDEDEYDPFATFVKHTQNETQSFKPFKPTTESISLHNTTTVNNNNDSQMVQYPLPPPPETSTQQNTSTEEQPTYYKVLDIKPYQPPTTSTKNSNDSSDSKKRSIQSTTSSSSSSSSKKKEKKDKQDKYKDNKVWVENIKSYLSQFSDDSDSDSDSSSDSEDEERRRERKKRRKERKREKKERKKEKKREKEKKRNRDK